MSVLIVTTLGDLTIDLYPQKCPVTCKNFVKLCKIKYYDDCLFHKVQKEFIAQTGDPTGTGTGGDSIYKFLYGEHHRFFGSEIHPKLNHSKTGTVAMASAGGNLSASQFYVTLRDDLDYLDGKHTVFGEIAEGFDTLNKINEAYVDAEDRPYKSITILETHILEDPFEDPPQLAKMIADEGKTTKDDVIIEAGCVPMDEKLGPHELEEVIPASEVKPPDNVLLVRNLNPVTEDVDIHAIFTRCGPVISAKVIRGENLSYAFIEFESEKGCEKAYDEMDNVSIDDRRIRVQSISNLWSRFQLKDAQDEKGDIHAADAPRERYIGPIDKLGREIEVLIKRINNMCTKPDLAPRSQWDLVSDEQMNQVQPLLVATCTKLINPCTEGAKYIASINKIGKFVVGLASNLSPTDIEEDMRVGVDQKDYQIQIPLPLRIGSVMTGIEVEEKPSVTYGDIGGCKEQIEKIREAVEMPMLHPEKFVKLGIDPPKSVLCYGPRGSGKTLVARAVANRTNACFIRVSCSELGQKYVDDGARLVNVLFQMARSKEACILFFEDDVIGSDALDDDRDDEAEANVVHSIYRAHYAMLEVLKQLDGSDTHGNIKVLMSTSRPHRLVPALPGRLDRKVEFVLPDLEGRTQIFKIHTQTIKCESEIRFQLLASLCPKATGNDIRRACIEAGMYAIGAGRKVVSEKDFIVAVKNFNKGDQEFSPYV